MNNDSISISNPKVESSEENPTNEPSDINLQSKHLDEKSESKDAKASNQSICNIISDIENSKKINDMLIKGKVDDENCPQVSINDTINQTADTLKNINSIKDELCKLPLNPCELEYINNSVFPLVNTLYLVSTVSLNLATSVNYLTISSIVHPKRSELKDTISLIYDINEECEELFRVIKKRLNIVLKD